MPEYRRLVDVFIDESGGQISIVLDGQSEWVRAGPQFVPDTGRVGGGVQITPLDNNATLQRYCTIVGLLYLSTSIALPTA